MLRYSAFVAILGVEPKAKWLSAFTGIATNTTQGNVLQVHNRFIVDDMFPGWTCGSRALWFAEFTIAIDTAKVARNYCERELLRDFPFRGRAEERWSHDAKRCFGSTQNTKTRSLTRSLGVALARILALSARGEQPSSIPS